MIYVTFQCPPSRRWLISSANHRLKANVKALNCHINMISQAIYPDNLDRKAPIVACTTHGARVHSSQLDVKLATIQYETLFIIYYAGHSDCLDWCADKAYPEWYCHQQFVRITSGTCLADRCKRIGTAVIPRTLQSLQQNRHQVYEKLVWVSRYLLNTKFRQSLSLSLSRGRNHGSIMYHRYPRNDYMCMIFWRWERQNGNSC